MGFALGHTRREWRGQGKAAICLTLIAALGTLCLALKFLPADGVVIA